MGFHLLNETLLGRHHFSFLLLKQGLFDTDNHVIFRPVVCSNYLILLKLLYIMDFSVLGITYSELRKELTHL